MVITNIDTASTTYNNDNSDNDNNGRTLKWIYVNEYIHKWISDQ